MQHMGDVRRQQELSRERANNYSNNYNYNNEDDSLLGKCIDTVCMAGCDFVGNIVFSCCDGIARLFNGNTRQDRNTHQNNYTQETPYVDFKQSLSVKTTKTSSSISLDDWMKQIKNLLKTNPGSISANSLYEKAENYYDNQKYIKATEYYWKAFVCGDGRAAYDLCIIFRDQVGPKKSEELASIMYHFSSRQGVKNRSSELHDDFKYIDERLTFSRHMLDYLSRSKLFIGKASFGKKVLDFQIDFFNQLAKENVHILGEESELYGNTMSECMGISDL